MRAQRSRGKLTSLGDIIRQMHTIGRMGVKYTTLGIVGYLLLRKYSCFFFLVLRIAFENFGTAGITDIGL